MVVDRQSTSDIIRQIVRKHKECEADYDKIYKYFEGGSLEDACYRLWKFCKKNFTYEIEDEEEQFTSCPYTMLTNGKVDCKNYSLFIAGILDAMKRHGAKLQWQFRFASYDLFDPRPGHVFVVVNPNDPDGGIWIDPVLGEFNWHLFYWHCRNRIPRHSSIAGIGRIGATMAGATSDLES